VEAKLEKSFPKEEWCFLHHALIAFGREECHAQHPDCSRCALKGYCSYFKKNCSTKGKIIVTRPIAFFDQMAMGLNFANGDGFAGFFLIEIANIIAVEHIGLPKA
jgi:adenine-specific DNA glycosylase